MRAEHNEYRRPASVAEAVNALAAGRFTILAGGTDLYAARAAHTLAEPVLDITAIRQLRCIKDEGAYWRIGATTTWSDIVRGDLPPLFRGLQAAAREVGGIQVQNHGTVAGNICNASPAADGVPALIALDAQVELTSVAGQRVMPLTDFVLGSRKIARDPGELVTALLVPSRRNARSSFIKLGHRRYLVIAIAMVAVVIDVDASGTITHARLAVGSCSAVARPLASLESKLTGRKLAKGLSDLVTEDDLAMLTPIDDVRGTGEYRRDAVLTLVKRALEEAIHEYTI
jgi:CO/xanthine dehydrogenase FAD-binding subunit